MSFRDVPESGGTHVRTRRVLTNVLTLGEIHMADVDSIFMSNCITYMEPEIYQESFDCLEHKDWKRAGQQERRALMRCDVMYVVRPLIM